MSRPVVATLAAMTVLGVASPGAAQRFELEVHGAGVLVRGPDGGRSQLPPPGASFTTYDGTTTATSRHVPSWYFGDGAALLNQIASSLGAGRPLVPLDPVLLSPPPATPDGGSVGARFGVRLNRRLMAELSFDSDFGRRALSLQDHARIEASRAGFIAAWDRVFAPHVGQVGPGRTASHRVTSTVNLSQDAGRQTAFSAALVIALAPGWRLEPTVAIGGALLPQLDESLGASLSGFYQRSETLYSYAPPLMPHVFSWTMAENDRATFRSRVQGGAAGVVGVGFKYRARKRLGLRADVRLLLRPVTVRTTLDTEHPAAQGFPYDMTLHYGDAPSLRFAMTTPSQPSSLSERLTGFTTYEATGIETQVRFSAGLYLRF